MLKLSATFGLGISLAAAAFQASVQQNALAVNDVRDARVFLVRLTQNGVQIDPQNQILQDLML